MSSSGSGGRFRSGEGDWICPDPECTNVNFARRTACNRCGKEKIDILAKKKQIGVEIGKAAAEKSRGLFSADDWQCSKCGNVNWARRQQCNMCNAPKFGEVEERTGYGGGYNDRGVVEYIEREESDDEYDEFGRRKKKKKLDNDEQEEVVAKVSKVAELPAPPKSVSPKNKSEDEEESEEEDQHVDKANANEEETEEDEEEEDDEDGDLSKYDLSGWGDDSNDSKASKEENEKTSVEKSP